jgi:hypothetical protein
MIDGGLPPDIDLTNNDMMRSSAIQAAMTKVGAAGGAPACTAPEQNCCFNVDFFFSVYFVDNVSTFKCSKQHNCVWKNKMCTCTCER